MVPHRVSILTAFVSLLSACNSSPLTIAPPRVTYGGRAVSIAVQSVNDKRIVVASETGGLFRTFDGGKSWQHLDNLPNNKTIDVASASLAPDIIIATTEPQYRTISDGGIWRSIDGGASWSQATGWAPPPGPGCPSRPTAYGISHMPLSRTFYVGTDCGLAVSNDDGATWSHIVLDSTTFRWDSAYNRVRSVLVVNRTLGVLAGERELWRLTSQGNRTKVLTGPTPTWILPPIHSLASPYWTGPSPSFFYASGDRKLWVSGDAGETWSQIAAPSAALREAFVRVARPLSMDESKFDVYYGDGMRFHRQTFTISGLTGSGSWAYLPSDHDDVSDVAFDIEHRVPILLASDGGVHITPDSGAHWKLTGGGYGGFTALQITEVTGQAVSGTKPHRDLYYVSHDNDFKASPDGGATWPGYLCCEGKYLRISPASVDHDGARLTMLTCGPCSIFVTGAHLRDTLVWKNAPDGNFGNNADAPFLIVGDAYLQSVPVTGPPISFDFYLTLSAGDAWSKSFSLSVDPVGAPLIAGSLANPTVFQGVRRSGTLTNGGPQLGLVRVGNIAGQAVVNSADTSGISAFGSVRTANATMMVLGVDPHNANHLIAPDVETNEMKFSPDGGANWYPLPQLTQAVTDGGKYLFTVAEHSFASVIAWDPYDSCHILVGTKQNGIIRSTDGGNSWARVPGSQIATNVSFFYFPPTGAIWVASDGRGLWTLSVNRGTGSNVKGCRFPVPGRGFHHPIDSILVVDPVVSSARLFAGLNDPAVCVRCSVVVIRNGWVTDLALSGDTVRRMAISGGTISQIDRAGKEIPLAIPNEYRPGQGRLALHIAGRWLAGSRRVRGVVMEGTRLKAVITARGEVPFAPQRTPAVFVINAAKSGVPSIVEPGASVRVVGENFLPPSRSGQPARILFGTEIVAPAVPVRPDGSFSVEIPVRYPQGEMLVTVEQQDGRRLTIEKTTIDVATGDRPENAPRR